MSYFCVCTFDLNRNASATDYQNAYADLAKIGFSTSVTGSGGRSITLPNTTTAGTFTGSSARDVKTDLLNRVKAAFSARRFTSEVFISVGDDWSWGHSTT